MPKLRDKEVLAFVDRIIFNATDVVLEEKTEVDGSCEASGGIKSAFLAFLKIFLQGKKSDGTSFTVPAGKAYAYTINELTINELTVEFTNMCLITGGDGEELQPRIPPSTNLLLAPETFETDKPPENYCETLQQVKEELQGMEALLQPLSCLPMATRSSLAQRLCDLSKDRDSLTQLKKALDLWCEGEPFDQPQSESVRTLLDQLRVATDTGMTNLLKAVYLLVSAMDKLPDAVPFIIGICSPDILRCVNQLVSSIKEHGQAHLPVSLPGPLQQGGELHWLTMFLCATDDKLKELGVMAGQRPGVLLLVLCVTVQGLSMMRA
ncbi:uncharacterized protein LOC115437283 isoform X3 [Scomber scombrus]